MSITLRKVKLPSGKTALKLDYYFYGKRRLESLGLFLNGDKTHNREILRMAETIRAKRELEVQSDFHGLTPQYHRKESFIKYVEAMAAKKQNHHTRYTYKNALDHLKYFNKGDVVFAEITKTFCEEFKDYLVNAVAPNTGVKHLSILKAGLIQAVKQNIIPFNPASDVSIKKKETLPVFLTFDEVKRLASTECFNESVKNGFLFSCFTGLRYSDVYDLRWSNISEGYLQFTQKKTEATERLFLGKQALRILEDQKKVMPGENLIKELPQDIIFYMPVQQVTDKILKRWATRAGLSKKLSFHKARHTFATMSLTYGVDIYTTSKLLGHKNLQTTQIYARVVDDKKKQAVDMLPQL